MIIKYIYLFCILCFISFVISYFIGTKCLYAPQPPTESNIEMIVDHSITNNIQGSPQNFDYSHQNTYAINSTVIYQCRDKTKFSHDYKQQTIQATCLEQNAWKVPDYWGHCKSCKYFKCVTTSGTNILI